MDYKKWNDCLSNYYFNSDAAGRDVVLYADEALINQIGSEYGVDYNDFLTAAKIRPYGQRDINICQIAYWSFYDWRKRWNTPPYIGYLIFFVLAAGTEGDYAAYAYYPRLNRLLGKPENSRAPADFDRVHELWEDLQIWSRVDMLETVGRFTAHARGQWRHVGLPQSQNLLTTEERVALPALFAESGLDPTSPPAQNLLEKILRNSPFLQTRTRRFLQQQSTMQHLKAALLELVLSDLKDWNGIVQPQNSSESNSSSGRIYGALRIGLSYDQVSRVIKTTIRFKTNSDLPEEEMLFVRLKDKSLWQCANSIQSWTTEFSSVINKEMLDASQLDWLQGEVFTDEEENWKIKLRGSGIRIFMEGRRESLPRWIETNRIESEGKYFIVCYRSYTDDITRWGAESCEMFRCLSVYSGLPEGWQLYELKNAHVSHSTIDVLQLPTSQAVSFHGGLRSGRGNKFFVFAPPEISVEGINSDYKVTVSGQDLERTGDTSWILPPGLPVGCPVPVEVFTGDKVLRASLQLEEPSISSDYPGIKRNRYGKKIEDDDGYCTVSGVNVQGDIVHEIPDYAPDLPTYLSHRIKFLGPVPGQIFEWPDSAIPREWQPVWAIARVKRDKWQAYYIGAVQDIKQSPVFRHEHHDWKKWKKVFTYLKVLPPRFYLAATLWQHYKGGAKKL